MVVGQTLKPSLEHKNFAVIVQKFHSSFSHEKRMKQKNFLQSKGCLKLKLTEDLSLDNWMYD